MSKNKKTQNLDMGRPPIYDDNYHPAIVYKIYWENLNTTLVDLANHFNVNQDTINNWCKVHKNFSEAYQTCRGGIKGALIGAALKEALGYDYYEEVSTKDGIQEIRKKARPQAGILKLLLSNFGIREKTEVVNTVEVNDELYNKAVKSLNDAELEQLHALIEKIEKQ